MNKGFENTGLMLLTDTSDQYEYAVDSAGVLKKYTNNRIGDRLAFVKGRSVILRLRGLS
jgi:hypothetical protein